MALCSNCGENLGGGNFCPRCGNPIGQSNVPPAGIPPKKKFPVWGIILIVCASLLIPLMIACAIAIPVFVTARNTARNNAQKRTCQANLRTINGAINTYYAEHEAYPPAGWVSDILGPEFLKKTLTCPTSGKEYVLESGGVFTPPTVSCPTGEPGHDI